MKQLLFALTLIAAVSCGSDDDDEATPRYNDVKVVLTNESENNFICGVKYQNGSTMDHEDFKLSVSYTLETIDTDGTVTSERIESAEESTGEAFFFEMKGQEKYHRIKDVVFHNVSSDFISSMTVGVCSYIEGPATLATVEQLMQFANTASDDDYVKTANLEGLITYEEHTWNGATLVTGTSDYKALDIANGARGGGYPRFVLNGSPENTMILTSFKFSERAPGPRDMTAFNIVWTITPTITPESD